MQEPINPLTESNTSSTTISRSDREQEIELLNPILSLNAMESDHKIGDLISNFKYALFSRRVYFIKAMWNGNDRLHNVIKHLDSAQSESLLKTVMGSSSHGGGKFITEYVNWLDDTSTIRAVLEKIQVGYRKKPSTYKANQIGVLQKRLDEIRDASQQGQNQSTDAQSFSPQEEQRNNSENQLQHSVETLSEDLFSSRTI